MRTHRLWRNSSARLAALLVAVVVTPAVTLVWLGLQLLAQDRELVAQRDLERREAAAQVAVRSFERSIAAIEQRAPLGVGLVRFTFEREGLRPEPPSRVWWVPVAPKLRDVETRLFTAAEALEYQGNAARARDIYTGLVRSPVAAVRAGALLRLARVERRERRWSPALDAYRRLAEHADIAIEGAPADLQARLARCEVLEDAGRLDELRSEAAALESDWLAGRWTLDRPAWELTAAKITGWTGRSIPGDVDRTLFSAVAAEIWRFRDESPRISGEVAIADGAAVTVLRRAHEGAVSALAVSPQVLEQWTQTAGADAGPGTARLSVLSATGSTLAGPDPDHNTPSRALPGAETGLPWTLVVAADPASGSGDIENRRRLLTTGLAAIVLLLAGGGYVLWRLVQRELTVGRLQTEFVAAVSHEFRTPLTSLRHVTELLEEGDDMPPERRQSFYGVLGRNTERLHKLVESLLDFARMEDGRKPYDLQLVDAAAIATTVVTDFTREIPAGAPAIDLDIDPSTPALVLADAPSLAHALWNLLDNAVKYSPGGRPVRVSIRRHAQGVAIAVHDQGLGVPAHERGEIFGRFVRGATAARLGIKGTGLGLAIVSHIAEAHHGSIELESAEGAGSTFRLVIPSAPSTVAGTVEPWPAS